MHHTDLRGTYTEMGRQQGLILRQSGFSLPPPDPKMLRFARHCEELVARHAPELLEEMHSVAEAAEVDYDVFMTLTLTAPFDVDDVPACTVLAVLPERTNDRRTIVGRNYDFFNDVSEEPATIYRTYPTGETPSGRPLHASAGVSDIWVGRDDGLNDASLFAGIASIFMPGLQPGLVFWLITRLVLDRCATVDEGLDLILSLPHAASWTYLLADASGKAAVIEPGLDGVEVRHPQDGLLIMTNHPVCPRWAGKAAFVPSDSRPRYNRLRSLLVGGTPVDLEMVKAALRDHEGLVCSHGAHFPNRKFGTLWSVAGKPGDRSIDVASGYPCQNRYDTVAF
jgi:predicted choloylglycine hydrolase